jgi:hypothetical protein
MNMSLISLLIALIALPIQVLAADKTASATVAAQSAILQTAVKGSSMTSNKQQYQVLPGMRAAQIQAQEQPQQTLSRIGGGKLVETKGAFVVFTAAAQNVPSVTSVNGASTYPTVLNTRTQNIGILPGTLSVKLRNMADATAVATSHGLDVVRVFPQLGYAYYRAKPGQDVVAAATSLAADPRVLSAEPEVIEYMQIPH